MNSSRSRSQRAETARLTKPSTGSGSARILPCESEVQLLTEPSTQSRRASGQIVPRSVTASWLSPSKMSDFRVESIWLKNMGKVLNESSDSEVGLNLLSPMYFEGSRISPSFWPAKAVRARCCELGCTVLTMVHRTRIASAAYVVQPV
jgi:hypothetical protein